jgi:hypothetical protein
MPDLYRVVAPHFVAGFEAVDGKVIRAAPILWKRLAGKSVAQAMEYCHRRGWIVSQIGEARGCNLR